MKVIRIQKIDAPPELLTSAASLLTSPEGLRPNYASRFKRQPIERTLAKPLLINIIHTLPRKTTAASQPDTFSVVKAEGFSTHQPLKRLKKTNIRQEHLKVKHADKSEDEKRSRTLATSQQINPVCKTMGVIHNKSSTPGSTIT